MQRSSEYAIQAQLSLEPSLALRVAQRALQG